MRKSKTASAVRLDAAIFGVLVHQEFGQFCVELIVPERNFRGLAPDARTFGDDILIAPILSTRGGEIVHGLLIRPIGTLRLCFCLLVFGRGLRLLIGLLPFQHPEQDMSMRIAPLLPLDADEVVHDLERRALLADPAVLACRVCSWRLDEIILCFARRSLRLILGICILVKSWRRARQIANASTGSAGA